ncbi:L-rhamnose isomerase/sugar isomerase [Dyadobacter sp. BE34]|uniref:L-rhamnose isomerase/sugar isomerase n=1 Tax=Dyadobacter fermentans TaxID=94254 RepID=A0ABU1QR05_9BACT|nr:MULTISPECIES: TIM barrel protein [Dyadobacter]MDR6803584.1 L-rhamnose isomerase/sugar isomerase [Dyadobacter fermentans]MDR7041324.1 L-rhamnose isomerase/sugar isomerase [Dyadobacter sp. BE242]MDR7195728.1 L-rhamnose isomerase/sugar isomerase [Dyadobacter sp. BE34]MDR7213728.1 L-rhamnose isomerase/sugar isomerase [Dyadobacter sp. BE31]MDR7261134.1 L-rhamnose isomerase/sugar isomerase [Dyadobacter sp. BE32]
MKIEQYQIDQHNDSLFSRHNNQFIFLQEQLGEQGIHAKDIVKSLEAFQVAIPSWALGTGGTRFGRFSGVGEPRSLEEKIEDVGLLHALNRSSGSISLHIPWDIPGQAQPIIDLATSLDLKFDAVNSNTFQDQKDQELSYKFGSLSHVDAKVRKQAVEHNIEVIKHGENLGSKALSIWLSDGSCFPGQSNFVKAFQNTLESLQEIYAALPDDWKVYVEYKAYEPNFYSTVIQDWGSSLLFCQKLGPKADVLVDLGHHLPNANIEQIVATLMMEGRLAGFHFNDSKYGDDDLTVGAIRPYQLFLIFVELVEGMKRANRAADTYAWMIDASHNVKDPLEDLLQSVEAILIAQAQALLVDRKKLEQARNENDVVLAQQILQNAFRTDVRPLVREAIRLSGGSLDPIGLYRHLGVRNELLNERGKLTVATGL